MPYSTIVIAPNGPLPRAGPFRSMTRLADLLCRRRAPRGAGRSARLRRGRGRRARGHDPRALPRSIERGLHVDDLLAVVAVARRRRPARALRQLRRRGHGRARGRARAARARALGYALPVVLTGGRAAEVAGPARAVARPRAGAPGARRVGPARLARPAANRRPRALADAALVRALRSLAGGGRRRSCSAVRTTSRPTSRATGSTISTAWRSTSCPASAITSTTPGTSSAWPRSCSAWLRRQELGHE